MSRAPLLPLLALALAATAGAQSLDSATPAKAPAAPLNREAPSRRAPSAMASRLAANGPKFVAPSPDASTAQTASTREEPAEGDTPRNQIYRLPQVIVEEARVRFKDRQILTQKEKIELAFKKYPGLRLGDMFGTNREIAAMSVADAERLERKSEMQELTSVLAIDSPEEAKRMKREAWRSYMRPPDFGRVKGAQGSNQRLGPFFDRYVD